MDAPTPVGSSPTATVGTSSADPYLHALSFNRAISPYAVGSGGQQMHIEYIDATYNFGPSDHWVDLLGYVATNEKHDGNTYYEETV